MQPEIIPSGDEALTVYLAESPGEQALGRVLQFCEALRQRSVAGVTDLVPSYTSVAIYYDLSIIDYTSLCKLVREVIASLHAESGTLTSGRELVLPVYYSAESGPDLERVAAHNNCSVDDVISLHSAATYRVYALGFRPGFGFMGMVPAKIRTPRLDSPRPAVPAGSVALAEAQTAVYPLQSPGGWNLIGLCPVALFDRTCNPPSIYLRVGDRVRFEPVDRERYLELGGRLDG